MKYFANLGRNDKLKCNVKKTLISLPIPLRFNAKNDTNGVTSLPENQISEPFFIRYHAGGIYD